MKKSLAILLALILVLANVSIALAENPTYTAVTTTDVAAHPITIKKAYTISKPEDYKDYTDVYPAETLTFEQAKDRDNPTDQLLIISNPTMSSDENEITVTLPQYTQPGVYRYTLKEKTGTTQGVTYATTTEISVVVVVGFDTTDTDQLVITGSYGVIKTNDVKDDTITNTYEYGGLTVGKTVSGNLGDKNKAFAITVTFTAEDGKTVRSPITYTLPGENTETTIDGGWSGNETVHLSLKDSQTVEFKNIPKGVTYTVVEDYDADAQTGIKHLTDASLEPNKKDSYKVTGEVTTAKTISTSVASETINNEKGISIDTGISVDYLPYVLLMAVAMVGVAVLVIRRKEEN